MLRTVMIALAMMFFMFVTAACPDSGSGPSPKYGREDDASSTMAEDGDEDMMSSIDVDGGGCTTDNECDDDNECTTDACKDGVCDNHPTEEGWLVACNDNNPCTSKDHCEGMKCIGEKMAIREVLDSQYHGIEPVATMSSTEGEASNIPDDMQWSDCWGEPVVTQKAGGQFCEMFFKNGAPCHDVTAVGNGLGGFMLKPSWWIIWREIFVGVCYHGSVDYNMFGCVAVAPRCTTAHDQGKLCQVDAIADVPNYNNLVFGNATVNSACFDPIEEKFIGCADASCAGLPGCNDETCMMQNIPQGFGCVIDTKVYECNGKGVCSGAPTTEEETCDSDSDCGGGNACYISECQEGICQIGYEYCLDDSWWCHDLDWYSLSFIYPPYKLYKCNPI